MIVVNPNHVVWLQQCFELRGEILIDPEIAAEIAPGEFGKIEPVMQDRPQHAVGEAVVEFLLVVLAQVDGRVSDVVVRDGLDGAGCILGDATAPAKPKAAVSLERRADRHFEPAGPCRAIRYADPV